VELEWLKISTVILGYQAHPLHLNQLCPAGVLERDISAVSRTITDARSRLSPKTVEAMELIRWAVRGSVVHSLTWMT